MSVELIPWVRLAEEGYVLVIPGDGIPERDRCAHHPCILNAGHDGPHRASRAGVRVRRS